MRKPIVLGVALGGLALLVVGAMLTRAGLAADVLPRAEGPAPWLVSRTLGITSYVALSLEVIFGLFLSTGAGDRALARVRSLELHRWLSAVAIGLVGAHAVALLGDGFARLDVLDLLVPFAARVRPVAVGLGVLAAYAMIALHVSFRYRGRIGARTWRKLHYLSFALYLGATAHGLLAGTDASRAWLLALYASSVLTVAALSALRVADRRTAPATRRLR